VSGEPVGGNQGSAASVRFGTVLARELEVIARQRSAAAPGTSVPAERAHRFAQDMRLKALALSGGGIRSATFNLGILQVLCERGLLRGFDYLSTVSGGGYIGSWLSAQVKQRGRIDEIEAILSPTEPWPNAGTGSPKAQEDKSITFLRQYSNYLTPRIGLLSIDTLSAIAGYLRNVILVQTMLIALLLAVLLLPRIAYRFLADLPWAGLAGLALLAVSLLGAGANLRAKKTECAARTGFAIAAVILPALAAAFLISIEIARSRFLSFSWYLGGLAITLLYGAVTAWTANESKDQDASQSSLRRVERPQAVRRLEWKAIFLLALPAGAVGAVALFLLHQAVNGMRPHTAAWFGVSIGPFVVLQILCLIVVFHLGLVGRIFDYQVHEWWARYGAWILALTVWLGGLSAIAVYGPALLEWLGAAALYAGGPAWLLTTLWGVLWGSSGKTGGDSKQWSERLLLAAPYVFILGLALCASYALHRALAPQDAAAACCGAPAQAACLAALVDATSAQMSAPQAVSSATWCCLGFFALFLVLAWRVDINLFSLHGFYRNRLTRCYLGAARIALPGDARRRPHPFTGFDANDDVELKGMVQRPYHVLNTALNISAGRNLAWQHRKAASFFFSPLYCGYEFPTTDPAARTGGFVATPQYMGGGQLGPARGSGPLLGSALAVSGAALSPNAGFHTSPPIAFLLTLFNVRLGRWCPNPASERMGTGHAPRLGGVLLLRELFGLTDSSAGWVYLSDGGHFDNLGLYEMVRRRARLVVAVDCGRDLDSRCDDLADTVRKCGVDLGTVIDIDVTDLVKKPALGGLSDSHVAFGTIHYPALRDEGAEAFDGHLILIKPTLTRAIYEKAADLRNYALAHADFPQQTTTDQWFNEAQFESYRHLGYLIGSSVLDTPTTNGKTVGDLLKNA